MNRLVVRGGGVDQPSVDQPSVDQPSGTSTHHHSAHHHSAHCATEREAYKKELAHLKALVAKTPRTTQVVVSKARRNLLRYLQGDQGGNQGEQQNPCTS